MNGEVAAKPPGNSASTTTSITAPVNENDNTKPKEPAVSMKQPSAKPPPKANATKVAPKPAGPPKSKLPFQSPKPEPKIGPSNVKEGAKDSSTSTGTQSQQPSIEHLKFSWSQGDSSNTDSQISPSGRRLSRRKWKPSEKVLETISMSPKKDGVIAAPPGLLIKPEQVTKDGKIVSSIPIVPSLSEIKSENGKEATTTTTANKTTNTIPGPKPTTSKPAAVGKSADKIPTKKKNASIKPKAPGTKKRAPAKNTAAKSKAATATAKPKAAKAAPLPSTTAVPASKTASTKAAPPAAVATSASKTTSTKQEPSKKPTGDGQVQ